MSYHCGHYTDGDKSWGGTCAVCDANEARREDLHDRWALHVSVWHTFNVWLPADLGGFGEDWLWDVTREADKLWLCRREEYDIHVTLVRLRLLGFFDEFGKQGS